MGRILRVGASVLMHRGPRFFSLARFLSANRYPPPDQVRGHASLENAMRRRAVSVTQQQVLDCLAKVASPQGVALTDAKVLSAISVNDGKVFFSINVDAAEARAWESIRAQAEAAVRAIPGVTTAMVALTAERKAGAAPPPPPPAPHKHSHGHGLQPVAAHRPPQSPASPMAKQAEIPGISAVIAVASGK